MLSRCVTLSLISSVLFSCQRTLARRWPSKGTAFSPNSVSLVLMSAPFPLFLVRRHSLRWRLVPLVWLAGWEMPLAEIAARSAALNPIPELFFLRSWLVCFCHKSYQLLHLHMPWLPWQQVKCIYFPQYSFLNTSILEPLCKNCHYCLGM